MEKANDFICVPNYPNTCPYDGARTDLIEQFIDHSVEKCLRCDETYRFWDEEPSE